MAGPGVGVEDRRLWDDMDFGIGSGVMSQLGISETQINQIFNGNEQDLDLNFLLQQNVTKVKHRPYFYSAIL